MFLEAFQCRGAPVAQSLLDAIDLLRAMNRTGARKVPADAPLGFVPQSVTSSSASEFCTH